MEQPMNRFDKGGGGGRKIGKCQLVYFNLFMGM